jgi:outer membrane protein OmpA-like peptidoglycan-associated protein/Tol biopolymer transport system component
MNKTVIISLFSFISLAVASQGLHTSSNRAVKFYNQGLSAYDYLDYPKAETMFREALVYDKYFFEAYLMLGELYTKQRKFSDAAENFRAALKIDSASYKPAFFSLASAEFMTGDYENARRNYQSYLKNKNVSEKNRIEAARNLRNCYFAIEAMKNPVSFNPESIGAGINTADDEYWPSISADGQVMMFTRQENQLSAQRNFRTSQEDFYLSYFEDGIWKAAVNAGQPLNTTQNEGAQALSSAGNYMFFTACERPGSVGSCDIYFSAFNNGKWTQPYNLGPPVNTAQWESTPSVSADGNMLFFTSTRSGGFGGKDLWYSILTPGGNWGQPVNMGADINTSVDEMSPFIHFDGQTLYFASQGHPGMGGFDIYLTRMNPDSSWSIPVNLGYPINTYNDETGLVIDASGAKAFFSSRRDPSRGKDIFYFDLYESARPNPVSYLKGKVYDKETGRLLKAEYMLINLTDNKIAIRNTTDEQGNFLVCLPSGQNYGLNVSKQGFLFYSESFLFEGQHSSSKPYIKRIILNPLKTGEKTILANVFYSIDSWDLKNESKQELNNLAELLNLNKEINIEIGGYTDATGTDEHNLALSEKRAKSVVEYLVERGIDSTRLVYKGYGNTAPVGDNVTVEGRRLNRRTEVKVTGTRK